MKKVYHVIVSFVISFVLLIQYCFAENAMLYPAKDANEKWGYINECGQWIIVPKYDSAREFSGCYAIVSKLLEDENLDQTEKYYVINTEGKMILQDIIGIDASEGCYWIYGYESDAADGFFPVGCFDWRNGRKAELSSDEGYMFFCEASNDGSIVPIYSPDLKLGFYDFQKERILFSPQFDPLFLDANSGVSSWNDYQLLRECENEEESSCLFSLLSSDGVALPLPQTIVLQDEGGSLVCVKDYFLNENGMLTCITSDNEYVLMHFNMQPITGVVCAYQICDENCIMVTQDGKHFQYINLEGQVMFEKEYKRIDTWINGYASIQAEEGQNRIIRKDGTSVSELPEFCYGYDAGNGITVYYEDGLSTRQYIFDCQSESITEVFDVGSIVISSENQTHLFQSNTTGLYGMINSNGDILQEPVYQIDAENMGFLYGMLPVRYEGKIGFLNSEGKLVIACQYQEAEPFNGAMAIVKTCDNRIIYINHKGNTIYSFPND